MANSGLKNAAFYVVRDRALDTGGQLRGERLSRPLLRISQAKRVLKRLRRQCPAAYVMQGGKL